ncbi:periplasmic nitrate reductase, NapE protein [Diaphorobacter aerolatus]|uniref:Periplasmic nitrate reductase, NapE protein n=1 Tax=Diaphorobacter aerolatus TaxID=1288495 RepID=A0A7H0GKH7_9BURK|nr:periplasmic nitrate reductase, NapE protein [Diaphorobacter aerolatus]QNP48793.1 periplasmic nitrate reductase, NapE protein [Diaphorobacter aerolatus]
MSTHKSSTAPSTKSEERRSFAFLTIVMAPVLSGLLIAAYGFLVWFYQMLFSGPPHA